LPDCERTGRDRRDQLHKTEETYTGTLIEITAVRNRARTSRTFYAQAATRGSSAEHRPGFTGFRRGGYGGRMLDRTGAKRPVVLRLLAPVDVLGQLLAGRRYRRVLRQLLRTNR